MEYILRAADVYYEGSLKKKDILVSDGVVAAVGDMIFSESAKVINLENLHLFPGFVDVHVHFREPGFAYKETIESGSKAAARGGYTSVCTMPNLNPVPDSLANLGLQLEAIRKSACINIYPYGAVTKGEKGICLSDMEDLAPFVAGFSDDGKGVQNRDIMISAMEKAKKTGKIIAAHCEDEALTGGGAINKGLYSARNGIAGIPSESEWRQIERDLELAHRIGCRYHVCHVSARESVELIRKAKKNGTDVTAETAPHYLLLDEDCIKDEGRFKMNPPLRQKSDRLALIEGIKDGTIDMIATDHAPHNESEKSGGLKNSLMGIVGIETSFPMLYTKLVLNNIISLEKLIELMCVNPSKRFGIGGEIKTGNSADLTLFDLNKKYKIDSRCFLSKGRSTPFDGEEVSGKCLTTICGGKTVWQEK